MTKSGSVDWTPIKTEYITTHCSYRQLSQKYHVSIKNIGEVSRREGWREQRDKYVQKTFAKAVKKSSTNQANKLAKLMSATTKAVDVAVKALNDDKQFNRYLVEHREKYAKPQIDDDSEDGIGVIERQWTEEREFDKLDTKALKELTGALKDLTSLMRDFYNLPTPAQAEAQRIAAERLELDKRKDGADDDSGNEVVVTFGNGASGEWSE